MQSGGPFTVVTQTNTTNVFSAGAQRANVIRDPNLPGSQKTLDNGLILARLSCRSRLPSAVPDEVLCAQTGG